MKKVTLLKEWNLVILIMMPKNPNSTLNTRKYIILHKIEELCKLRKCLAEKVI